ncbi:MAG: hypothetical protein RKP20_06040 [Candidatus Competibacter sp.]|nr:hypothetical protein [Candidatus Competibacter sp.]
MDRLELTKADEATGEGKDRRARQIGGGTRILDTPGEPHPKSGKQKTSDDRTRIIPPSGGEMKEGAKFFGRPETNARTSLPVEIPIRDHFLSSYAP